MTEVLITGGCGFVGHHLIEHIIKNTDWNITVLDRLTYASNGFDRLRDINVFDDKRVRILAADFTFPIKDGLAKEIGKPDYILHLGGETHVDRSIDDAAPFVMANVLGTMRMLDFAKTLPDLKRFVFFGTDEVFGPAPEGTAYKEWDNYNSGNPYAATKAGAEEMCLAYANTHKVPVTITHCMNVFGERQHPEKFIPMCVRKILAGNSITIHANEDCTKSGSRYYIHARNVAAAVLFLLDNHIGKVDKFNIVGEKEVSNLDMARSIAKILNKTLAYELVDFHGSRPGHDLRYALDGTKMKELEWQLPMTFNESLKKTIKWMIDPKNKKWLDND